MSFFSALFKDKNGDYSTSKVWRHIAFGTATYELITINPLTWEFLLAYLAVVSGSELGKRMVEAKYNLTTKDDPK
jgi:hypothetical protein